MSFQPLARTISAPAGMQAPRSFAALGTDARSVSASSLELTDARANTLGHPTRPRLKEETEPVIAELEEDGDGDSGCDSPSKEGRSQQIGSSTTLPPMTKLVTSSLTPSSLPRELPLPASELERSTEAGLELLESRNSPLQTSASLSSRDSSPLERPPEAQADSSTKTNEAAQNKAEEKSLSSCNTSSLESIAESCSISPTKTDDKTMKVTQAINISTHVAMNSPNLHALADLLDMIKAHDMQEKLSVTISVHLHTGQEATA